MNLAMKVEDMTERLIAVVERELKPIYHSVIQRKCLEVNSINRCIEAQQQDTWSLTVTRTSSLYMDWQMAVSVD